jgi:hypothetical protein
VEKLGNCLKIFPVLLLENVNYIPSKKEKKKKSPRVFKKNAEKRGKESFGKEKEKGQMEDFGLELCPVEKFRLFAKSKQKYHRANQIEKILTVKTTNLPYEVSKLKKSKFFYWVCWPTKTV